mgnify:FL=1
MIVLALNIKPLGRVLIYCGYSYDIYTTVVLSNTLCLHPKLTKQFFNPFLKLNARSATLKVNVHRLTHDVYVLSK